MIRTKTFIASFIGGLCLLATATVSANTPGKVHVSEAKLPLQFVANQGQADERVKFISRGRAHSVFLTPTEAVIVLKKWRPETGDGRSESDKERSSSVSGFPSPASGASVLRMRLDGSDRSAIVAGEEIQPGTTNYLVGNDPEAWQIDVRAYGKVRYTEVYPGIDLLYYGNQRKLEYDFVVNPGSNPHNIRLVFEGQERLEINTDGDLIIHTGTDDVIQYAPVIYQTGGESGNFPARLTPGRSDTYAANENKEFSSSVSGRYILLADNQVGFQVDDYDSTRPLIIDPVLSLSYSTYLGGSGDDYGHGIAVDSSGNIYITGQTSSEDFSSANSYQSTNARYIDAFVTKLSSSGALVYSTYLGGNDIDYGSGIAVDSSGNAYITGRTISTNFPTTSGVSQTRSGGSYDAFVAKLDSSGSLVYSTYLGGAGIDFGFGIAVDSSGNAHITGQTGSSNFPMADTLQTTAGGGLNDAFVTKLNSSGRLVYSTYLGGDGSDTATGIAVDSSGNAYITGSTDSSNFPTANALQTVKKRYSDAFVTKLNSSGAALYSTYLGGNNDDYGLGVAADSSGNAYITGLTSSTDFATAGAYQTSRSGNYDAFVTKLSASGLLVYSTYLGGSGNDQGNGIAVDSSGKVHIAGMTSSSNFPISNAAQASFGEGFNDAFATALDASGSAPVWSTYLGGSGDDYVSGIAADSSGNAYVTGRTYSTNFSTTSGAYQTTNKGAYDAFVVKLSLGSAGTVATTTSLASSLNPSTSGASVTFTVSVSGSTPSGTVTFMDGATTLGSGALSGGQTTYTTSSLSAGTHSITVVYGGDGAFAGSTSSVLTQTVASTTSGSYSGTYSTTGVTIHLAQSPSTLTGIFSAGSTSGNMGGFLDSSGRVYTWAWWDSLISGSGVLAGKLTVSGTQAIFSFGGGQTPSGIIGETILSGMTQATLSGSTTTTASSNTTNYAGTYTTTGLTITLTQSSSTLSGTFSSGDIGGNMGGFVDSSGRAYIWAYWDSLISGSGAIAGKLTVTGTQATISFGGGQSSGGTISEIVLSGMTRS